jgi:hypothetical protein
MSPTYLSCYTATLASAVKTSSYNRFLNKPWLRGLVVLSPPATEDTGAMGREIESRTKVQKSNVMVHENKPSNMLCTKSNKVPSGVLRNKIFKWISGTASRKFWLGTGSRTTGNCCHHFPTYDQVIKLHPLICLTTLVDLHTHVIYLI